MTRRKGPVPIPQIDRAFKYIKYDHGCWTYTGYLNRAGYGHVPTGIGKSPEKAHRLVYTHLVGPIPEGMDLDHLCRNRACVNPNHVEPVTHQENLRRSAKFRPSCPAGHPYSPETSKIETSGARRCLICRRQRDRVRNQYRYKKSPVTP